MKAYFDKKARLNEAQKVKQSPASALMTQLAPTIPAPVAAPALLQTTAPQSAEPPQAPTPQ